MTSTPSLSIDIKDEERLFRAVTTNPDLWKTKENKPSSALFFQKNGVSVDREGYSRSKNEIENNLKRFFRQKYRAIVSVTAGYCREISTYPEYKKTKNEFHSLIKESPNTLIIQRRKRRLLAKKALIFVEYRER